jgi:hypothetical protein
MGYGSSDYNSGAAMGALGEALAWKRANDDLADQNDDLINRLDKKQYVANGLENFAANRTRKVKAWDIIVQELVRRTQNFDPDTRYRIFGVCKGQDASPEDTMRALRDAHEQTFQMIKSDAPKDNSDTDVPAWRKSIEL